MHHVIRAALALSTACLAAGDDFALKTQPFLKKYCVSCHGPEKSKGGIKLHKLDSLAAAFSNHKLLESIIEQVESGDMPPDDEDLLPTDEERQKIVAALGKVHHQIQSGDVPRRAGRVTLRRLNRNEYHYTVRDLFGVKFNPSRDFPADGSGGEGFDNMADALFSTPTLLEKYLAAAKKVVAEIYRNPTLKKKAIFTRPKDTKSPEQSKAAAEKILSFHATLAYRRRVSEEDLAPLMNAFARGQQAGMAFEDSLRAPLVALLINPRFLFRAEHDEAGKDEWKLNDFEVATRLAYFLWSSMPDRELFRVADAGQLTEPEVLKEQTLRMIASPKANALARHFAGQWLGFHDLVDQVEPDPKRFPEFDLELRKAMYFECVEFFSHLMREDRPLTELIDANYTFVNAALARHYGLSEPLSGAQLQKVALNNPQRGGVIGMGGILTSTSLPLRTSPVKRGVWILDALLGDPAPPPPPDAGELPADDTVADGLTLREQLQAHRRNEQCANCHDKIDPLGFSLENFDAIGRWREKDANGKPIDSTAVVAGGLVFHSPKGLKELLLGARDKFARNMTRKMISYATGRGLEYYDEAVVNEIIDQLARDNYSMHHLILSVVQSRPFLYRSRTR